MDENKLSRFIVNYIEGRKQPKLEAFDKVAEKKLSALTDADEIAVNRQTFTEQRRELEKRYEVRDWLSDAANRVWQIKLATHAPKYTHGDSKSSGVLYVTPPSENSTYLSSSSLASPAIDVIGNAAIFDVAKLLQQEVDGESLINCLVYGDNSPLMPFSDDLNIINDWASKFTSVIQMRPSSHKLAKQLYFPVGDDEYHLLSPLFSSSLAHAMHSRISEARFSDASKEIYQAFKTGDWHPEPRVIYPKTAVVNMGGTKPQNISYLNSVRGGRVWLLPCAAPVWQSQNKPPLNQNSIFQERKAFSAMARDAVWQLKQYLRSLDPQARNAEIRQQRAAYVDEIIDTLFSYVAGIQNREDWQRWSMEEDCQLSRAQQLWLDPWRMKQDKDFQFEREGGDWKKEIAIDFGVWLNHQLKTEEMKFSEVERREWSTTSLFKRRLREFEQEFKEGFA
ncbi:type I-F CRISPR-associated protein Csy1 [Serratia silvae]|uniref:Type I-F CRISPR-associated protein Csy1 n=1 Tax=Serratia silvae TaxID=2824122 RepID=A0ABT0KBV3_9GAMM|nr:type I-F CRISPR-associated protein Csy1 [Serratia silvae]MCL1029501.1 type I-F CRISPR-associated protein Csy1 [Serratia silvae]